MMGARSEYDAAYFTLLRAREEHADLLHYREFLIAERDRLDAFVQQVRAQADTVPRRMRRPIDQTTKAVVEAIGVRRSVILGEYERVDERIANAQAFVEECEAELEDLRRSG